MHRQRFIPARNSRHRIAVLSLYRALLRSAAKIPIPEGLQSKWSGKAIQHAIRKRFDHNRSLTSSRLTFASMTTSYKFLSLFAKALDQTSPEYAQITSYLERSKPPRTALARRDRTSRPSPPAPKPFLLNISQTDRPHYVTTYTPPMRRNTNMGHTSDGQPFLRLKPQPRSLSKTIGLKGKMFVKKILQVKEAESCLTDFAALEDEWEIMVAAQMARKGLPVEEPHPANFVCYPACTYTWNVQLSKIWWEWQLEKIWQDWIARGDAISLFVEQQRGQDQNQDQDQDRDPASSSRASSLPDGIKLPDIPIGRKAIDRNFSKPLNVSVFRGTPFPSHDIIEVRLRSLETWPPKQEADPFLGLRWKALVQGHTPKLREITLSQINKDLKT
ncbi:hypothetical protein E4U55_003053 [Claviceps digitariae]|nr:hypothetical protein E4U55_003053 [Claviceps digitariae]